MICSRCGKRLSRKTARTLDGKTPLCSPCLFAPAKADRNAERQDRAAGLGPKDESGGAEGICPKGATS